MGPDVVDGWSCLGMEDSSIYVLCSQASCLVDSDCAVCMTIRALPFLESFCRTLLCCSILHESIVQ